MYRALAYKEWLKIRWFYLGCAVIGTGVIIGILLNLRVVTEFYKASSVWSQVVFLKYIYYESFLPVPVLISMIISGAQFFPEIQNQRLKLNLHLPADENRMLLYLVFYVLILIMALNLFFIAMLSLVTLIYFPVEVLTSMLITVLPWFIAGISTYFLVTSIMIESLWSRRIIFILLSNAFVNQSLIIAGYSTYTNSWIWFLVLSIVCVAFVLVSGFRFKTGVR